MTIITTEIRRMYQQELLRDSPCGADRFILHKALMSQMRMAKMRMVTGTEKEIVPEDQSISVNLVQLSNSEAQTRKKLMEMNIKDNPHKLYSVSN